MTARGYVADGRARSTRKAYLTDFAMFEAWCTQHARVPMVDCPPAIAEVQRSALLVGDVIVLPCGPTPQDAWSLLRSLKLVEEAKKRRPQLDVRILINRVKSGTALGKGARDVLEKLGSEVMRTEMHDRVAYPEAIGQGLGVTQYAARSEAADEVRALVDELIPVKKVKRRAGR